MKTYSRFVVLVLFVAIAGLVLCQEARPQDREPISPDYKEVAAHLVGEMPVIRMDFKKFPELEAGGGVSVELIVDEQGNVTSARLDGHDDGDEDLSELTESEREMLTTIIEKVKTIGMTLHFRPFEEGGHPVPAQFVVKIPLRSIEDQAAKRVPFPQIHDWNSIKIVLSRMGCYGTCPSYSVEVHGDGTVLYSGARFVAIKGSHHHSISSDVVSQMVEAFRAADYFSLKDKYIFGPPDLPTYKTSISFDGRTKEVTDYDGEEGGMPKSVSDLEDTIDHLSGVERWTKGDSDTVPALIQERFDFKSSQASEILARVAKMGNADAVRDLVAAGVVVSTEPVNNDRGTRETALENAAARGDVEMLGVLLSAGIKHPEAKTEALARAAYEGKIDAVGLLIQSGANAAAPDVLVSAVESGIPAVVQKILKYRPDVNGHDRNGTTALIASLHHSMDEDVNVREVVRMLVDAGADPNIADSEGKTPLILNMRDLEIAQMLLAHGANVNARAKDGFTPLLNAGTVELTRFLLEHGADPFAKTEKGETALDWARQMNRKDQAALLEAVMSGRKQ